MSDIKDGNDDDNDVDDDDNDDEIGNHDNDTLIVFMLVYPFG